MHEDEKESFHSKVIVTSNRKTKDPSAFAQIKAEVYLLTFVPPTNIDKLPLTD